MAIRDAILPEYDYEMATTRKTLERVPETNLAWAPHPKSMNLGRLAGHIAELPRLASAALAMETLELHPPGAPPREPTVMTSRKQVLEMFDSNVAAARAAIAAASDSDLAKTFTFMVDGKQIFSQPRNVALRGFFMNHVIHHRGQLTVYLRLNNVAVPSIYGPSADEGQA